MEKAGTLPIKTSPGGIDQSLLMAKLEKSVLDSANHEKCRKALDNKALWQPLNPADRIKWARLAQMAGGVDIAVAVLGQTVKDSPSSFEVWTELAELLVILDRKEALAGCLAAAKNALGEDGSRELLSRCEPALLKAAEDDLDKAEKPFGRFRERSEAVALYMDLFSGREDCFARQWADRREGKSGYVPVRRTLEPGDVEDHLSGRMTYGIYLMKQDSTVSIGVIDLDLASKFRSGTLSKEEKHLVNREATYAASRIREAAAETGSEPLIEFSGGKGYHFWFFFETPAPARNVRDFLRHLSQPLEKDLTVFHMEMFPKQDGLSGKGFGNLVKLPLGVHRLTGKRSLFAQCNDRNPDAQLQFLRKVKRIPLDRLSRQGPSADVVIHPRWEEWSSRFPELALLEEKCPPIGQLIAAARSGKALNFREEKVLLQTVGFTDRGKTLMHALLSKTPEFNPHMMDYRLSRLAGKPLGCRKIHSLLNYTGDFCPVDAPPGGYVHPLLHLNQWKETSKGRSEKTANLAGALEDLQTAIENVRRFLA